MHVDPQTVFMKNKKEKVHEFQSVLTNATGYCFRFSEVVVGPRGLMDKASDFGSEDCEFESRRGRYFINVYCNDHGVQSQ